MRMIEVCVKATKTDGVETTRVITTHTRIIEVFKNLC